jgi:hypothetical protein
MSDYRIEYLSDGEHPDERLSLFVPDLTTALVVAEINRPDGEVELWDGDRQLGHLQRDADCSFWKVG